jgi:hypothetical protein
MAEGKASPADGPVEKGKIADRDREEMRARATAPVETGGSSKKGPPSSLVTGKAAGAFGDVVGKDSEPKAQNYSVQIHTDEKGLEVIEPVSAESGDEAALKALKQKNFKGASVRGVQPYSDPDANSLGGEREAANMIKNANNPGAIINTLGTEANAEMHEKLGKHDIEELGQ